MNFPFKQNLKFFLSFCHSLSFFFDVQRREKKTRGKLKARENKKRGWNFFSGREYLRMAGSFFGGFQVDSFPFPFFPLFPISHIVCLPPSRQICIQRPTFVASNFFFLFLLNFFLFSFHSIPSFPPLKSASGFSILLYAISLLAEQGVFLSFLLFMIFFALCFCVVAFLVAHV